MMSYNNRYGPNAKTFFLRLPGLKRSLRRFLHINYVSDFRLRLMFETGLSPNMFE